MRTLVLLLLSCVSCGGKIEGDGDEDPSLARQGKSSTEAEEKAYPAEGPWGTWQLLAVGKNYEPPFIELALHENGDAFMWRCDGRPNGIRCENPIGCTAGTLVLSGNTWRIQLTSKDGQQQVARGDVSDDPSGDLIVDGDGLLPAGGLYRRLGAAKGWRCLP